MDVKKLKIGCLKKLLSEPEIGLMYSEVKKSFIEVFEINKINQTFKFIDLKDNEEKTKSILEFPVSKFVIKFNNRIYQLNKSQWAINNKFLNKEVPFYFKGKGPVRIWNLTVNQQAELIKSYNSAIKIINNGI